MSTTDEFEFAALSPRGRKLPDTRLGRVIVAKGLRAYTVAGRAAIAPRTISDYTAAKKPIPPEHLTRLCAVLECDPEDITEP